MGAGFYGGVDEDVERRETSIFAGGFVQRKGGARSGGSEAKRYLDVFRIMAATGMSLVC